MKTREEYKEGFEIMNNVIKSAIDYSTLETVDVYDKAEKEMLRIIEDLLKPYGAEIYTSRRINGGIPQISVTAYFKNGWSLYTTLHGSSFNSSWFTVFHNKQTVAEKQYTFAAEKWKKDNRYRERDIKSLSTKLEYAIEQMKNHEYDVYANKHLYPNGLPEGVKAPPLKAFNEVTSSKKNITSGRWNVKINEGFEVMNNRQIKSGYERNADSIRKIFSSVTESDEKDRQWFEKTIENWNRSSNKDLNITYIVLDYENCEAVFSFTPLYHKDITRYGKLIMENGWYYLSIYKDSDLNNMIEENKGTDNWHLIEDFKHAYWSIHDRPQPIEWY